MAEKADNMLLNFDINKEMEPYKYYVKQDQIESMAEALGIDKTDLQALSENLESWDNDKGGVDENGLYGISTKNQEGQTDYWSIMEVIEPSDDRKMMFENGTFHIIKAFVTPDGKWIDGPWIYGIADPKQKKELETWNTTVSSLLDTYANAVVVIADCHI